jgi:hypothetical protein
MLLDEQATTELMELSEEASERLGTIEEERRARKKYLEAIDKKHKKRVATIAYLAVSGLAGLVMLPKLLNNNPRPNIAPPDTTILNDTVIPKNTLPKFRNSVNKVAQSVVVVWTKNGHCSGSVVGTHTVLSAAHCKVAVGDTIGVPFGKRFDEYPIVGVAAAAVGDAVLIQTSTNLNTPIATITSKTSATHSVATLVFGFPSAMIFRPPVEGREIETSKMKRHAFETQSKLPLKAKLLISLLKPINDPPYATPGSNPQNPEDYLNTDVQFAPSGMSGGPGVDSNGNVMGVLSAGTGTEHKRRFGYSYIFIQSITQSTQFCVNGQRLTAEEILAMQNLITGNNRCS